MLIINCLLKSIILKLTAIFSTFGNQKYILDDYAISQLNKLEESIWERWTRKRTQAKSVKKSTDENSRSSSQMDTFDGSRKDINAAIDRTKIVFWDLREAFIDNLYKPSVSQSRMEALIEPLDVVWFASIGSYFYMKILLLKQTLEWSTTEASDDGPNQEHERENVESNLNQLMFYYSKIRYKVALNQLCDIIMEPLRDRVVTGLLQASLDGLYRVIVDGGPSRVFSPFDAKLLEEDLEVLKEFFISGGDGLPRGVVENHVARVRQVVKLHGCETRELIENLKSASGLEMQGGKSKLGIDTQILLRILCHRSDSEASQFLKKQYKIPKSAA
ncbi:hypothetical protein HYC85_010438 [Camellia sinensis]|uniref:MHD2 domain-containing protein n=1 Tax=Camellia sinensis TaxID=4442 RepID=A0A7J7HKI4_CAMSI|nr:hypothetical protein HYC85_010438 [Camellia sinensis]